MGAFASDDEGSFFLRGGELQVIEHVAELLAAALHAQGTHPIASLPATDNERESEIGDSGSFGLLKTLNLSHFHQELGSTY